MVASSLKICFISVSDSLHTTGQKASSKGLKTYLFHRGQEKPRRSRANQNSKFYLTQENVAEYLGVSTPAVSKWENGTTYPDIMLLPALARLLKTDLNTLMSFNEEMSEIEINNVVLKVQSLIQEDGFEKGFQFALDQVRAFPTCENLIYSLGLFLQPSLAGVITPRSLILSTS